MQWIPAFLRLRSGQDAGMTEKEQTFLFIVKF